MGVCHRSKRVENKNLALTISHFETFSCAFLYLYLHTYLQHITYRSYIIYYYVYYVASLQESARRPGSKTYQFSMYLNAVTFPLVLLRPTLCSRCWKIWNMDIICVELKQDRKNEREIASLRSVASHNVLLLILSCPE